MYCGPSQGQRYDCRLGGYVVLWGESLLDQEPLPASCELPWRASHVLRLPVGFDFVFTPSSPARWIHTNGSMRTSSGLVGLSDGAHWPLIDMFLDGERWRNRILLV